MEFQRQPAVGRALERAAASDRGPGEGGRTTVVVIGPQPVAAGPGGAAAPIAMPAPGPREPADVPPSGRAIEALIERTTRPMPVPGLEFRLLKPAPRDADERTGRNDGEHAGRDEDERAGRDADEPKASARRRPAAPPPAAPPLDVDAVADKVYRLLQRRQRLERERKGHL